MQYVQFVLRTWLQLYLINHVESNFHFSFYTLTPFYAIFPTSVQIAAISKLVNRDDSITTWEENVQLRLCNQVANMGIITW